jgi:hypothetical protein
LNKIVCSFVASERWGMDFSSTGVIKRIDSSFVELRIAKSKHLKYERRIKFWFVHFFFIFFLLLFVLLDWLTTTYNYRFWTTGIVIGHNNSKCTLRRRIVCHAFHQTEYWCSQSMWGQSLSLIPVSLTFLIHAFIAFFNTSQLYSLYFNIMNSSLKVRIHCSLSFFSNVTSFFLIVIIILRFVSFSPLSGNYARTRRWASCSSIVWERAWTISSISK